MGNGYLHYAQLLRWEQQVTASEFQQIVDFAISLWNQIDYDEVISYYGNYDAFLRSLFFVIIIISVLIINSCYFSTITENSQGMFQGFAETEARQGPLRHPLPGR